ncbi:MAG TPA: glycosyltransferase [Gemmatimonadaceae bacterium]|nr:glycosyltransferase [Gemmatimonadaceae bacterium]
MQTLAWVLVFAPVGMAAYAYAVYPALLVFFARMRTVKPAVPHAANQPLVTIVVPAYNEARQIRGAIEALIAQDYPAGRRQILIVSDGSTDGTDAIVREFESRGVELLRTAERGGKTAAENAARERIRGEIVVNSDASIRLHPRAVSALVAQMADPSVGVASSRDVSIAHSQSGANTTEAGYVGYEMHIRSLETRLGGIVGASGSGYAIRAALHMIPVRADLSRDFSAALTACANGFRAVSADDAICYVPRTPSLQIEYRRKVRTIARGVRTLIANRRLLNPFRSGLFAWKLASHKICRWLVPALLPGAVIGLVMLGADQWWARVALILGAAGAAAATAGALWPASRPLPRLLSTLTFAAAANVAVVHAIARVVLGRDTRLWEPTRRESPA